MTPMRELLSLMKVARHDEQLSNNINFWIILIESEFLYIEESYLKNKK